jgi:hypothetical protein
MKTANQTCTWSWSGTATFVLLAFLAVGTVELGGHHLAGAVMCFVLAAVYVPLRLLRGHLLRAGGGR